MIALEERIEEIMSPHVDTIQLQAKGIHDLGLAYQETNGVVLQFGNLSIKLDKEAKTLNKTLESYANQLRSIMVIGQELGSVFQASFNAAMVEGLDFFDALREGLKNYVKQMAVAVASTLALATALSIIFPNIGFRAAFNVYSSFPAIYSFVPSMGSINQKILFLFLMLKSTVSSDTIGIFGVSSKILLVINLLQARSPLLTGELSDLISIFSPFEKRSMDSCPAMSKVSIKPSAIFFNSLLFISNFF